MSNKLKSRKLWVAVIGIAAMFFDIPPNVQAGIVTIIVGYLGAQGVTDAFAAFKRGDDG